MDKITEVLFRIQIPLPFPLKLINTYAIKGVNGWTIIDTGLHTKETEHAWEDFLKQQKSEWTDIEKIVLTHYHPDHYGAAGWLQEKSKAPVFIAQQDYEEASFFWKERSEIGELMQNFYMLHGMPSELASKMKRHLNDFIPWVTPQPEVTFLKDGDLINLGDDEYLAIATPGHSAGHLCFYNSENKCLFSGDHILQKITPNISLWPNAQDGNPLFSFIESLNKIKQYDIDITYPAHKSFCPDVKKRIDEIITHHEERLERIISWVGEEATGYQVCEKMFGPNLSVHQLRFAMAETLAHIVFLESNKKLTKERRGSQIFWFPLK